MRRGLKMSRRRFEALVRRALAALPQEFRERLENIDVVVEERPSRATLHSLGLTRPGDTLYGLYQGIPLPQRGSGYNLVLPDRISLYRQPILEDCASEAQAEELVRETVIHEAAHYFGFDDEELGEIEGVWS